MSNQNESKRTLSNEELQAIENLAERFSLNTFAYHEREDIKQEVWVICLESIDKFDPNKSKASLETFLFSVVKNELTNMYNKLFRRINPPAKCKGCSEECKSKCKSWKKYKTSLKKIQELQIVTLGIDKDN